MLPYFQSDFLKKDIQYLKGIGPKIAKKFRDINIFTIGDLIFYPPLRYEDHSDIKKISESKIGESATHILEVVISKIKRMRRRNILDIKATDGSAYVHLIFFNRNFLAEKLRPGDKIIVYGKLSIWAGALQITHPEISLFEDNADYDCGIVPIYSTTEGLRQYVFRKCIKYFFSIKIEINDLFPELVKNQYLLLGLDDALRQLHFPESIQLADAALKRLKFEEFFYFQLGLMLNRKLMDQMESPILIGDNNLCERFINELGFSLTNSQIRAWERIKRLLSDKPPMRALLQGDVGAGKTVIAYLSLLKAVESGYQGVFLAPTEVLAEQQYIKFKTRFGHLAEIAFLSSSIKGKKRGKILNSLASGEIDILIGTHAVIEDKIEFKSLGMAIIDEQHRFGVEQRERLLKKGENTNLLVMTATPIPRTLSLTLFGEMDVIYLDELPGGRKEIKTFVRSPESLNAIYEFIIKEANAGNKAFIVCPLIDESEKINLNHVIGLYEKLSSNELKCLDVGLLHGRMKSSEKEETMNAFREGRYNVLVSTTVIEVGVDIPEATVMVILDAERFGISQLHQLRGRVGRSGLQAYCVLVSENTENERLRALAKTNDGFKLAEMDLKLRGAGEFLGTQQHGAMDFRIGDLIKDKDIMFMARKAAQDFINSDTELELLKPELLDFLHEKFGLFHERMS